MPSAPAIVAHRSDSAAKLSSSLPCVGTRATVTGYTRGRLRPAGRNSTCGRSVTLWQVDRPRDLAHVDIAARVGQQIEAAADVGDRDVARGVVLDAHVALDLSDLDRAGAVARDHDFARAAHRDVARAVVDLHAPGGVLDADVTGAVADLDVGGQVARHDVARAVRDAHHLHAVHRQVAAAVGERDGDSRRHVDGEVEPRVRVETLERIGNLDVDAHRIAITARAHVDLRENLLVRGAGATLRRDRLRGGGPQLEIPGTGGNLDAGSTA